MGTALACVAVPGAHQTDLVGGDHSSWVAEFELHYLTQLLTQAGGNMSRAARVAGIDRTTLYRLLERHGLDRKGDRGSGVTS